MLLDNKIAVVYGAGGSVGGAVARAFAAEGARLFLAGRTLDKLQAVALEISSHGGTAACAPVDALAPQEVEAHISAVAGEAGRIDILFNAIGMQDIQGRPLVEMPLDDFLRPIMVGARTQFATACAAAKVMIKQRSGVIMTITAGPARRALPNVGGFDAACATIEALWRTLAAELGPSGIRLVVVGSAGSPDSPDVQATIKLHAKASGKSYADVEAEFGTQTLLKRLPKVAEVARTAVLHASDYASAMTAVIANATCGYIVD
jgi:NAD(P)-dependent dehydrogenase (short-subunit alcohol dehydrogenase family)